MLDQGLLSFIKNALAQGKNKQEISALLIAQGGWNQGDIDMAFTQTVPPASVPPVSGVVVSPMATSPQLQLKKSGKWKPVFLLVIILLVLGTAGASAYYYLLPASVSRPDPKKEIAQALLNTLNLNAFSYSASYEADVKTAATTSLSQISLSATTTGAFDLTQPQPALESHVQLTGNVAEKAGNTPFSASGNLDFKVKLLNKTVYFILNSLSISGGGAGTTMIQGIVTSIANAVEGKWLEATSTPYTTSSVPDTATISNDRKILISKLQSLDFITTISQLADATINSVSTYHYSIVLDLNKLQADMTSLATSSPALTDNYQNSPVTVELFIGKKDVLVYEYLIPQQQIINTGGQGTVSGTLIMSNFNQPAGITVPVGAIPLQTFLDGLMGKK